MAESVIIAALIEHAADCQQLVTGVAGDIMSLLEGDVHLAAAGKLASLLERSDLEQDFSQALMAAALGKEFRKGLERTVESAGNQPAHPSLASPAATPEEEAATTVAAGRRPEAGIMSLELT